MIGYNENFAKTVYYHNVPGRVLGEYMEQIIGKPEEEKQKLLEQFSKEIEAIFPYKPGRKAVDYEYRIRGDEYLTKRWKIGYRYNAVDIHSHFLPGVDDGAQDMTESIRLLAAAREEGVRDVIATPHYGIENGHAPKAGKVRETFEKVRKAVAEQHEDDEVSHIRLYLGEEVYCAENAAERFRSGEALKINETRYALVEFLEYENASENGEVILRRLEKLKKDCFFVTLCRYEKRKRSDVICQKETSVQIPDSRFLRFRMTATFCMPAEACSVCRRNRSGFITIRCATGMCGS